MKLTEWEWFESFATGPLAAAYDHLFNWCWLGTHTDPPPQVAFPPWGGLDRELAALTLDEVRAAADHRSVPRPITAQCVELAVGALQSATRRNRLVGAVRDRCARTVREVASAAPQAQQQQRAQLDSPPVLLMRWLREEAVSQAAKLCVVLASTDAKSDDVPAPAPPVSPAPDFAPRAWAAFVEALPELLKRHPRQWIAFRGAEQVLIAPTQTQAFREAKAKGYPADELLVMCIVPDAADTPVALDLSVAERDHSD